MKKQNLNICAFLSLVLFISACSDSSKSEYAASEINRELDPEFHEASIITPEQQFEKDSLALIEQGFKPKVVKNGNAPDCYNFTPKHYKKLDNELRVTVGGGTDVAIKLMNYKTDKCIRYVFINSGSTYRIRHIPEGEYYLKIAYGKNWMCTVANKQCSGRFLKSPLYEKGEDIMDFHVQRTSTGYSIPSYSLELDVISTSSANSFASQNISEDQFNL